MLKTGSEFWIENGICPSVVVMPPLCFRSFSTTSSLHFCSKRFASEIVLDESSQKPIGKVEDDNPGYQVDERFGDRLKRKESLFDDYERHDGSEASKSNAEEDIPFADLLYCGKRENRDLASLYQDGFESQEEGCDYYNIYSCQLFRHLPILGHFSVGLLCFLGLYLLQSLGVAHPLIGALQHLRVTI